MYSIQVGLCNKGNLWKAYGFNNKQYKIIPTTYVKITKLIKLRAKNYEVNNYKWEDYNGIK